jgi:hypothetical protein
MHDVQPIATIEMLKPRQALSPRVESLALPEHIAQQLTATWVVNQLELIVNAPEVISESIDQELARDLKKPLSDMCISKLSKELDDPESIIGSNMPSRVFYLLAGKYTAASKQISEKKAREASNEEHGRRIANYNTIFETKAAIKKANLLLTADNELEEFKNLIDRIFNMPGGGELRDAVHQLIVERQTTAEQTAKEKKAAEVGKNLLNLLNNPEAK